MLTFYAPFLLYIISFPMIFLTLFRVEIGILYFITFVPIISLMQKLSQFPLGNNIPDYLLIAMFLGTFVAARKEEKPLVPSTALNKIILLLVIWSFINLMVGYTSHQFSSEVNSIRLMTWKNYIILPIIYFVAVSKTYDKSFLMVIIFCICLTILAMDFNFWSTFRWLKPVNYSDSIRISGPFGFLGPNELGIFYSQITFFLLGISYFIDNKHLRYFIYFVCTCNFYPILYSYSRAAYFCCLAGLFTIAVLKNRKFFLILIFLIIAYKVVLPNSVVQRIDMTFLDQSLVTEEQVESSALEIADLTIDTVGRVDLWRTAIDYFKEHPLIGIGFDTFRHLEQMITHSLFLRILAEQGLIGMIIYLIFTTTLLMQSYRLFRYSKVPIFNGIGFGFFLFTVLNIVGSLTGDQSLYYNMMSIFWVFIGIVARLNYDYHHYYESNNEMTLA